MNGRKMEGKNMYLIKKVQRNKLFNNFCLIYSLITIHPNAYSGGYEELEFFKLITRN